MKGLVVQNPWAWCIAQAADDPKAKRVENRGWPTDHRGDLAIIAGRRVDREALDHPLVEATITRWTHGRPISSFAPQVWPWEQGVGAVLCVVDLYDVCDDARGWTGRCGCPQWAVPGEFHHRYRNVRPLDDVVPVRGWLGLRDLPADVESAVREQLAVLA
jgi:hypothetical protein